MSNLYLSFFIYLSIHIHIWLSSYRNWTEHLSGTGPTRLRYTCEYIYLSIYIYLSLSIYLSLYISGYLVTETELNTWVVQDQRGLDTQVNISIYLSFFIYLSIHIHIWLSSYRNWTEHLSGTGPTRLRYTREYIYLSIFLYLSINPYTYLAIYYRNWTEHLSGTGPTRHTHVNISIYLSIYIFLYLSIYPYACISGYLVTETAPNWVVKTQQGADTQVIYLYIYMSI